MINFKKQLETAEVILNKNFMDLVTQISIAHAVKDSIFTVTFERLLTRKLTDDEFNKICKYIYYLSANMSIEIIADNVMRAFTVNTDYEEVTTLTDAAFNLNDLDNKDRRQELFEFVTEYISENVEVESVMFYDFFNEFDKIN